MLRVSTQSKVFIKAPIKASKAGTIFDPRSDPVTMTFSKTEALTGTETWNTASWEVSSTPGKYLARCAIGPSSVVLTAGIWYVFTKVTDNPEAPVLEHGPIEVY